MHPTVALFAQRSSSSSNAAGIGFFVVFFGVTMAIWVVFYVFYAYCTARIFRRAGITEWWAWVPFVNTYGLWKMTARDELWLILLFVPYANLVAQVVVMGDIARSFAKSQAYGWGLALLGVVFIPMLAFDDSPYLGPAPTDTYPWSSRPPAGPPGWYGYGYGYPAQPGQPPPGSPPTGYPPPGYPPPGYPPPGYPPPGYAPPGYPPSGSPAQPGSPTGPPPSSDPAGPARPGEGPVDEGPSSPTDGPGPPPGG